MLVKIFKTRTQEVKKKIILLIKMVSQQNLNTSTRSGVGIRTVPLVLFSHTKVPSTNNTNSDNCPLDLALALALTSMTNLSTTSLSLIVC